MKILRSMIVMCTLLLGYQSAVNGMANIPKEVKAAQTMPLDKLKARIAKLNSMKQTKAATSLQRVYDQRVAQEKEESATQEITRVRKETEMIKKETEMIKAEYRDLDHAFGELTQRLTTYDLDRAKSRQRERQLQATAESIAAAYESQIQSLMAKAAISETDKKKLQADLQAFTKGVQALSTEQNNLNTKKDAMDELAIAVVENKDKDTTGKVASSLDELIERRTAAIKEELKQLPKLRTISLAMQKTITSPSAEATAEMKRTGYNLWAPVTAFGNALHAGIFGDFYLIDSTSTGEQKQAVIQELEKVYLNRVAADLLKGTTTPEDVAKTALQTLEKTNRELDEARTRLAMLTEGAHEGESEEKMEKDLEEIARLRETISRLESTALGSIEDAGVAQAADAPKPSDQQTIPMNFSSRFEAERSKFANGLTTAGLGLLAQQGLTEVLSTSSPEAGTRKIVALSSPQATKPAETTAAPSDSDNGGAAATVPAGLSYGEVKQFLIEKKTEISRPNITPQQKAQIASDAKQRLMDAITEGWINDDKESVEVANIFKEIEKLSKADGSQKATKKPRRKLDTEGR